MVYLFGIIIPKQTDMTKGNFVNFFSSIFEELQKLAQTFYVDDIRYKKDDNNKNEIKKGYKDILDL